MDNKQASLETCVWTCANAAGLAIIESLYFGAPVFGTPYGSLPRRKLYFFDPVKIDGIGFVFREWFVIILYAFKNGHDIFSCFASPVKQ